ncbi:MAG: glycerate kinase, partial [Candidatus Eremiobacteraeota bacterium]|nr:glycerate kinase [Candidatus Eremiobacteraeota bacterium]
KLAALGARLRKADGSSVESGGAALATLAAVDLRELDPRLRDIAFEIAADVDAPLVGSRGASAVFGPQKGASARDVARLDDALRRFADVTAAAFGTDVRSEPGTGAAGGLAFALRAYLGARARPGVEVVAELRGLAQTLRGARWCFTGEGAIDGQTLAGKTVAGVGAIARAAGVPTIAFTGRLDAGAERALADRGVVAVPIADAPLASAAALARASELLERAAARSCRLLESSARLP